MTEPATHSPMTVALLGEGELPRAVELALERAGTNVRVMRRPNDRELGRLTTADVDAVVVVSRDDIDALRLSLLVEHARPGVPLVVTLFDRTVAEQLRAAVPRCRVMSLADMVAPTLAGPCLDETLASLVPGGDGRFQAARSTPAGIVLDAIDAAVIRPARRWAGWWPRPFESSARFLVAGLLGFAAILGLDFAIGTLELHESPVEAAYAAVKALVTVGPNPAVDRAAGWVRLVAAALMLCAVAFAAILTAGIINRLLDERWTAIVGRRAVPRRGHVVVVGLGQVGLRLCILLRDLGVPVVAVERRADAPCLPLARHYGIPVVIGSGGDRLLLQRLRLGRARALAAVTSDDLENVAVAVAAVAVDSAARVIIRAGDGDVATETRALFHVGLVRDLHRIAADLLAAAAMGWETTGAAPHDGETWIAVAGEPSPRRLAPGDVS